MKKMKKKPKCRKRRQNASSPSSSPFQHKRLKLQGSATVGFLALGSLGDCLPLCAIAESLKFSKQVKLTRSALNCFIVTNATNIPKIRALRPNFPIEIRPVNIPVIFQDMQGKTNRDLYEEKHKSSSSTAVMHQEMDLLLEACKGATVLCFNLYSIVGYHLADALSEVQARLCLSPALGTSHDVATTNHLAIKRLLVWSKRRLDHAQKGYFPQSVEMAGQWFFSSDETCPDLPLEIQQFLIRFNGSVVCVDFGSMFSLLGAAVDWKSLLGIIKAVLDQTGHHGIFLNAVPSNNESNPSIAKGADALLPKAAGCSEGEIRNENRRESNVGHSGHNLAGLNTAANTHGAEETISNHLMMRKAQCVPHDQIFPHCSFVIHHGGSGTTATAARCGIPQIVIPFAFDQRFWAEKVEWLGVGQQIINAQQEIFPSLSHLLLKKVSSITSPAIIENCRSLQEQTKIITGCGFEQTIKTILFTLSDEIKNEM
mmetsp:Transcript_12865/g.16243  ORF Transcript_12865/g.16243 Transcript_12865/m.16243 type:complete len:484 (-) Transcript_12865:64-1515(-)